MKAKLKEYAELIFDNLLEGCQILNRDLEYVYLNKSAIEHSKKSPGELIGKKITECYPGIKDSLLYIAILDVLNHNVPRTMINRFIYPDSSEGVFKLKLTPIPDGLFIMSEDITESSKAEIWSSKAITDIPGWPRNLMI